MGVKYYTHFVLAGEAEIGSRQEFSGVVEVRVVRQADIVVAAVGRPNMVKGDWIKPGAVVIDVGINRVDTDIDGETKSKLTGDVDYDEALAVAAAVTPVPGGVGPMTIIMLMSNTLRAATLSLTSGSMTGSS